MDEQQIGRLALRSEGYNWNAYYAQRGTMEGALLIGSIRLAMIQARPERKEAFIDLMRECVGDILEEVLNRRPEWEGTTPAPEHERSGLA